MKDLYNRQLIHQQGFIDIFLVHILDYYQFKSMPLKLGIPFKLLGFFSTII